MELVGAGLAPTHERQTPVQSLDLPALQSRCQRQILASECYQRYRELGITYGPAFQAIEQLRGGEGEAIARFRLPSVVAQTQTEVGYVLHPSVLDAALHASIGLFRERDRQLQVPFALSDLSIVGEVKASGWARVAWRQGSTEESLLDIEVCDDEGRIAVRMSGLSTRAFLAGSSESLRTALLTPDWKEETLVSSRSSEETAMHSPSLIVLCDLPESLASRIQAELAVDGHCRSLSIGMPTGPSSASQAQLQRAQRFQEALVQLIQELQRLWSKPKGTTTTLLFSTP